jgi:hypothetical protein
MAQKWLDLAERSEHEAWNTNLRLRALQTAIWGIRFNADTDSSARRTAIR